MNDHHQHQSHSEWSGLCCLQCIREKEVGVVEDLGTGVDWGHVVSLMDNSCNANDYNMPFVIIPQVNTKS
jgi:hypothetical protein